MYGTLKLCYLSQNKFYFNILMLINIIHKTSRNKYFNRFKPTMILKIKGVNDI